MFLDDPKTRKQLTKWAVGTVAACILIFLGIRYVSAIAIAVRWLYDLVEPLLTGTILAMVLNVPLAFLEKHLFRKNPTPKKERYDLCVELATDGGAWLNMIKEGATMTFEAWGKDQKWNTSLCHPWATAPLIIFTDSVRPY